MRFLAEKGPEGVGVAAVSQAAGLTHGGFYGQFASKQSLLVEAVRIAVGGMATRALASQAQGEAPDAFLTDYLSVGHVRNLGGGCPLAGLSADVARLGPDVRSAYADGLRTYVKVAAGESADTRAKALAQLSQLVGGLIIARALTDADDDLADEVLRAARGNLP